MPDPSLRPSAVRLSGLAIRHFRNLGVQELEVPREGVALIGDNAQGKSNLLEAVYYLETFRSFRGATDEQMVEFGQGVFRVVGTIDGDGGPEGEREVVTAAYERQGRKKKVTLGGEEPDRLGDALGHLGAVVFSPSDVDLVSGGPAERRRFLDIVLSLSEPGYLRALQEYRAILSRRNAALKDPRAAATVPSWNDGLVRAGAVIVEARRRWLEDQAGAFGGYYARISAEGPARMTYRPGFPLGEARGIEAVREAFLEAIRASHERERRVGATLVGPHRDDVRIQLGTEEGVDLRDFGSGGQRRTAALAMRLVEARTVRERRGRRPLILLDDVFAELDGGRSERVLDLLEGEETGQVLLTAPKEEDVRVRSDALARWRIERGRIVT